MTRRAPLLPLGLGFALGAAMPLPPGTRWLPVLLLPLALSPPLAPLAFLIWAALLWSWYYGDERHGAAVHGLGRRGQLAPGAEA